MRRNILLATVGATALLLAACDNKNNEPAPTPSPSAQTEDQSSGGASGAAKQAKNEAAPAENQNGTAEQMAETQVSDIGFAKNAAMGDMYEISASRIALERSQSQPVKDFAQQMIDAHNKTTTDLKGTLPPSTVSMLPADLDVDHQNMIQELRNATDADFDRVYIAQQREAHQSAEALFKEYADQGSDARLKQFAQDTLPAIEQHMDKVASLESPKKMASKSKSKKRKKG